MLIPIRCFTCGKEIASHYEKYKEELFKGKTKDEAMTLLGITRYCCRRMYLGDVDLLGELLKYP